MASQYQNLDYIPADSRMHRIDPRCKLLGTMFFMLGAAGAVTFYKILFLTLLLCLLIANSRISLGHYWRGLRPFMVIILLAVLTQVLFSPSQPYWLEYRFLHLGPAGLQAGALIGTRITLILCCTQFLLFTTSSMELMSALESLLRPFSRLGLPTAELIMIMGIALRFLPLLIDEAGHIRTAQTARGADFHSRSLRRRWHLLMAFMVPLFNCVLERADDLAIAMECRGYVPGQPRTRLHPLRMKAADYFFAGGIAALAVALVI